MNNKPYTTIADAIEEGFKYISKRSRGEESSLLTPFTTLNRLFVEGLPWSSHLVIGARSGVGKTLIKDQLLNAAFDTKINPNLNVKVLDFSLEMPLQATGLRLIQGVTKIDKSTLLSTYGNKIPQSSLDLIEKMIRNRRKQPWSIETSPSTVDELRERILQEINRWSNEKDAKIIVALDHSLLVKGNKGDKEGDVIAKYSEMITNLRSNYGITVITLSQLNRNIEDGHRKIPGRADNYPQTSDISSSDKLLHHCDFMFILNRPSDFNLKFYGPEKFIVPNHNNYVALHVVKNRSGEHKMIHLNANYANYVFEEMAEPPESNELGEITKKQNPFKKK